MADFIRQNLAGSRFEDLYLTGARFHGVDMSGVVITDTLLRNVSISGEIDNLQVNGVDVVPLVEAELNRRYPDRVKMRPTDADGFREAWAVVERLWAGTVGKARALPEELLHERVGGEWSFVQTLRHLVFATDLWVRRPILGEPEPWHPLARPDDDISGGPITARDDDARPSLDEVLALRADRMGTVRQVVGGLTDEQLAAMTEPRDQESFPVRECLTTVIHEEWSHRLYAERDLDVLLAR